MEEVAFKWPLKKIWDLAIKRTQEMVTMIAKGKRRRARLTYSKR